MPMDVAKQSVFVMVENANQDVASAGAVNVGLLATNLGIGELALLIRTASTSISTKVKAPRARHRCKAGMTADRRVEVRKGLTKP